MGIGDILGNAGGGSNKLIVWALVLVIIFGFGKGKRFNNFSFPNQANFTEKSSKNKYYSGSHKKKHVPTENYNNNQFFNFSGGNKGFGKMLGGNVLFVVVIIAVIFFCKEKEEKLRGSSTID